MEIPRRLAEMVKTSEQTIQAYLDLLALEAFAQSAVQAGHPREAAAVGNLMTTLLKWRKIKS
jgi:hypothetical protein